MSKQVAVTAEPATSTSNLGTALVLLSIALVFFVGVIAKYWLAERRMT